MTTAEMYKFIQYEIIGGIAGIVIVILVMVLVWYIKQVICIRRFYKMSKEEQRKRELSSK